MGKNEEQERALNRLYDGYVKSPDKDLAVMISKKLDYAGIMYRIFSRVKDLESTEEKINKKRGKYTLEHKKMQDLIGIRIVLYFKDDVDVCIKLLKELFDEVGHERDQFDSETFKPQRINYVFQMKKEVMEIPDEISELCMVENTFEVQIRTIFSEGWHEVEHDIRYKYHDEWVVEPELSRDLNGIFAVLEMCDRNMLSICEQMSYKKYKAKDWDAMIRNRFRLRISHEKLKEELCNILSENPELAKKLFRSDREKLICFFANSHIPVNSNNILWIINEIELHNSKISETAPKKLIEKCRNAQIL